MKSYSLARKFIACLIAGITLFSIVLLVGRDIDSALLSPPVIFSLAGLALLSGVVYPFIWHFKRADSVAVHTNLVSFIAYGVAFSISIFGWKKIFKLQFQIPLSVADIPFNQLSGEWLTWGYFGYSYPFSLLVAFIQIGGSVLLLFRQTRLLGVFVLLPVMLNILFINVFYHLNAGALLQSITITLGLLYLLSLHYQRLLHFLFPPFKDELRWNLGKRKVLILPLILVVPFVLVYFQRQKEENPLIGKFEVEKGTTIDFKNPKSDEMKLTKVYFDVGNVLVLEYGSSDHRTIAPYSYNRDTHALKATFNQNLTPDLLLATLTLSGNQLIMKGKANQQTIDIQLKKIN